MKKRLIFAVLTLLPCLTLPAKQPSQTSRYEMPRTQVIPIQDTQSNRQYELYIKLPKGYAKSTQAKNQENSSELKKYPVIYFTDAVWHIEILSAATYFLMENVILVGISWQKDIDKELVKEHGEHVSRFRDYSLIKSSNPKIQAKYQLGQASNHLAFIRNDVIKYVENNYRTLPEQRTYFGYSAGGALGSYILLSQPDTFNSYILGSPALEGDIPFLTELEAKNRSKNQATSANVFISYGSLESELAKDAEPLLTLLKDNRKLSLTHKVIEGSHQSAFPLTGVQSVTWLSNLQN